MDIFIPFEPEDVLRGSFGKKLLLLMFVIFFFLENAGSLTLLLPTYVVFTLYFSTAKLYKTLFYADIVYFRS